MAVSPPSIIVHSGGAGPLLLSSNLHARFLAPSSSSRVWGQRRPQDPSLMAGISRAQPSFLVLANSNVTPRKGGSSKEVIMVDPLEAKRLAAKQMEEIRAREKLKRRRQIEAINGAWAMIGLTAGIVMEGQTGNGILAQLASYWSAFCHLFIP
ncbi:PREDICTED: uncharacterized protein LOC104811817 [Tarenaya hassleriana]|uniref:uncharacterized protein LOC104811817 n=1 Tax=Tarenaya hassleriana TaxID=28532 RepID=UPI00053C990C|nr:PREDICTED: uncharacterized protein LOC104811817 [Tarenaya hassleriana]